MEKLENLSYVIQNLGAYCTFEFLVNGIFFKNNIKQVNLYKNWRNDETIFETPDGKRYKIADNSYVFNSYGIIHLEEFNGVVREIKEDNNIRSCYADDYFGEGMSTFTTTEIPDDIGELL